MLYEFADLLTYWQVWLGVILFGAISVWAMKGYASLPMSNRSYSYQMTFLNFLYVSALVGCLGPFLIVKYKPHLGVSTLTLLHFVGYGALCRFALQYIPYPTPNPMAAAQAIIQLAIIAFDFSIGTAVLWPGWPIFLALTIGGLAFIAAVESVIKAFKPQQAVTIIVAVSGFVIMMPLLTYAAWLRTANLGFNYFWVQ